MTNPQAALAKIVSDSVRFHSSAAAWVGATLVTGTTSLSLCAHLLYAMTFSTRRMVVLGTRARSVVEAALAAFFCAMGIRLLTDLRDRWSED